MMTTGQRKVTQPLEGVTVVFGALLLALVALAAVTTLTGSGSFLGFGHGMICANLAGTYGSGNWTASQFDITALRGASVNVNGTIQACTAHPGMTQRALYTLTSLPSWLVWAGVLFLLGRLISSARRAGPFTARTAATMRRLGWLIIAGTAVAALIHGFAQNQLLNTMVAGGFSYYTVLLSLPFQAMVPVAALAGAALLTFARITRLGAAMDDEIRGTV
jgi:hypothetical protein